MVVELVGASRCAGMDWRSDVRRPATHACQHSLGKAQLTRISHLRVRLFLNSSSSGSTRPAQGDPQSSMRPLPLREPLSQRRRRSSLSGTAPRGRLLLRLLPYAVSACRRK